MEANTSRVGIVSEKSQRTSSARATCTAKADIWKWLSASFQDICELQRVSHSPSPLFLRKFYINLVPFETTSKLETSPSAVFLQVTNWIKSTRNTHSGLAHSFQTMVIQDRRDTRFTVRLQPAHRHASEVTHCTLGNWTKHFLFFCAVPSFIITSSKTSAGVL